MSKTLPKILSATGAVALAVTLSACGGQQSGSNTSGQDSSQNSQNSQDTTQDGQQDVQQDGNAVGGTLDGAVSAIRTAEAEVDGSKVSEIDFDDQANEWEVKVVTQSQEVDVHVQADGSSVVRTENPEKTDADDWAKLGKVKVDLATALKSATQNTSGTIDEANIDDTDSGTIVWEIDIYPNGKTESTQLLVNVESGDVSQGG